MMVESIVIQQSHQEMQPLAAELLVHQAVPCSFATERVNNHGVFCRGTKDCVSTKVDIYSFGVLLWEIVTGISPRFGVSWFRPPRSVLRLTKEDWDV